jgi:hypothetical protein
MPKTTTKKTKKSPTSTKKAPIKKTTKKVVAAKKSTRKTPTKKKTTRTTKKVSKEVVRKVDLPETMVNPMDGLKKFFSVQKNVIILVAALVFLGVGYLLKDVFIVAMVNGKPVYRWTVIQKLEEQGGRQILDSIITEKLVEQAIKESGVVVEQEDIDAYYQELEDRLAAQGLTLDQALEQEGMTKEEVTQDFILQKSAEQIVADRVEVTDEEIDLYVEENAEFFPEETDMDSMRGLIAEQLKANKINEEIQVWVQEVQDNAKIIYMKDYELAL